MDAAPKFGFCCIRMKIAGKSFEAPPSECGPIPRWECRIPILGVGFIEVARDFECAALATIAGPFIDVIHAGLEKRIRELRAEAAAVAIPVSTLAPSESSG
jgi:hypothetical protein